MGAPQGSNLNTDTPDGIATTGYWGDPGDSAGSKWFHWFRAADGGIATLGAKADAAAGSGTVGVIALLKYLAGAFKTEDAAASSGELGMPILAVRRDAATSDAAAGDYHLLHVDALGRLRITGTHLEDAASADGDAGHLLLAIRRDTQTTDVGTAGDYSGIHVDALGRVRVSDRNEPSAAKVSALAASLVVKASAGKLFGFAGYSTTAQFIQVHNASSLPADTAVPDLVFPIEANKPFSIALARPHVAGTGLVICNSTTGPTKTIGSANTWITAWYE